MNFDFDHVPDRRGTDSQKWQKYADRDVLPLWVADMDFPAPPAVLEALHRRVDHGVFGYARPVKSTVDAFVDALASRPRSSPTAKKVTGMPSAAANAPDFVVPSLP